MNSTFYIIYPSGDRSKLDIVEIFTYNYLIDYDIAHEDPFYEREDAESKAEELAKKHGKEYRKETDFLT